MSKEPLTPATVNADPAWADAVRWILFALIQAEEMGITQANVDAKLAEARRLALETEATTSAEAVAARTVLRDIGTALKRRMVQGRRKEGEGGVPRRTPLRSNKQLLHAAGLCRGARLSNRPSARAGG